MVKTTLSHTEPSSVPYRAPPACAKTAAHPDPPPVIPVPDTSSAQVQTSPGRGLLAKQVRDDRVQNLGRLKPEMFPGIGALPEPATDSVCCQ